MNISVVNLNLVSHPNKLLDQQMEASQRQQRSGRFFFYGDVLKTPEMIAGEFEKISNELLKTRKLKSWFRAYFNHGMANYVRGGRRLLPCEVGTDMFFVDPYGIVMPCNGMDKEAPMGDLTKQTFDEIWNSDQAQKVRDSVKHCDKNCWMIGSVAPAMKKDMLTPIKWIIKRKLSGKSECACD